MKTYLLSIVFIISWSIIVSAQQKDFVQNQGITSSLHQANIGRIIFTSENIPLEKIKESDFLSSYNLTNRSNLFITVYMDNSLTNYLHRLAPDASADVLVKNGNYQFSFYVDERLIYQSNLHPGAPYAEIKNKETTISKPLINNQNEGAWWSQSAWNRFMNNGGDSVLSDGKHILKMEIRPYLKYPEVLTGDIIASGQLTMQVKRKPKIDISAIRLNVINPYSGLPISSESFDRDKIKQLKANIDDEVFKHITSVIVIKNGKLLIEEYFNGSARDSLHDPRSVGKSFASTLTGIAISEGYLKSENQTLKEFYNLKSFSNYSSRKDRITIKDLLTMSSVFDGNDEVDSSPGNEENMYPTANWVKFALDLPIDTLKPKGEWHYFTAGAVLIGDILNKSVYGGLEAYAAKKLFTPLNITNYKWQYTPQKVVNTAGGIQMNALDFAKYGQMYKNGGKWNGEQILSKEWVDKTFTKHKSITGRLNEFYGFFFWNKNYKVNGKEYETFYCAGNGGNKIYIFKDEPLVIVVTATAYGASYAHPQVDKMMENYILPSVLQGK